jgi:hypothetical protein
MTTDPAVQKSTTEAGAYILGTYRDKKTGVLRAADAVSALGALAGIFAQIQARAMLQSGAIPQTANTLAEVSTSTGEFYYFGDAINACVMEGSRERPSFWNLAAGAAQDPKIGSKIDVIDIARHTSKTVGTPEFGKPRIDKRYKLSEAPIDAVRAHGPWLLVRFLEHDLSPSNLMWVWGSVAQSFAAFAAGEIKEVQADVAMKRADIVKLYMEAAIPASKLDLRAVGMAIEEQPKAPLT